MTNVQCDQIMLSVINIRGAQVMLQAQSDLLIIMCCIACELLMNIVPVLCVLPNEWL